MEFCLCEGTQCYRLKSFNLIQAGVVIKKIDKINGILIHPTNRDTTRYFDSLQAYVQKGYLKI